MYVDDELYLNDREIKLLKRCLLHLKPTIDINSREFNNLTTLFKKEFANAIENKECRYQAFETALLVIVGGDKQKMLDVLKYGSSENLIDRFIMVLNNSELLKQLHIT